MSGSVPSWSIAVQCIVAGTVLGLVALQTGWLRGDGGARRAELRSSRAAWTLAWSVALAAVALLNGVLGLVTDPVVIEVLLALRLVALGVSVTLGLPAIAAFTAGPSVRGPVLALSTWYAVATLLWLTTDLVHLPAVAGGLPGYGPLAGAVDLVPVIVVAGYVGAVVARRRLTAMGAVMTVAGFVSAVLLVASSIPPPTTLTELLKGVWALPLVLALQALAAQRVTAVRRAAARRSTMRTALATVANGAWLAPTPEALLDLARDEARAVLVDPSVAASLRPLSRDRFAVELWSAADLDEDAQTFLADLARVVSTAAERHALTARLRRAAFVDVLTDLPTRAALDEHLADLLAAGERPALLLADVEGLKHTNSRRGHRGGDEVLVQVARHLATQLDPGVYLARVGGDEFAAVLPGRLSADELRALGKRLRDSITAAHDPLSRPRLSIGLTHATGESPADLQRQADLAMVEARRTHAGVAYFDDRLREREAGRVSVHADLEQAVAQGRIIAHFQPVADPTTLEVVGVEVLARWQDGDTLRAPGTWLPLAEETGLIVEIGQQIFAAARDGLERFGVPVAVNVSARQIDEPDVVSHIVNAWGPDAWDQLTIEVTESALLHDDAHVRAVLTELARRGARIALDDFGTGYNSLARLGSLPLHVLKIDRSLVEEAGTDEGMAVLRAVVALAEAHGLETIAEGVEQRSQLAALVELGVDLVQGNLVGRPRADLERASAAPTQRPSWHPRLVQA